MSPVQILIVEDNPSDAELVKIELRKLGILSIDHVLTVEAFKKVFSPEKYTIILCDYNLGENLGTEILDTVRAIDTTIPFIMVSGAIGEERAVAILKQGATDYVLKSNLSKLSLALPRALKEVEAKQNEKTALEALIKSEEKYKQVVENQSEMIARWQPDGKIIYANQSFLRYNNIVIEDLQKKSYFDLVLDKVRFEKKISGLSPASSLKQDIHSNKKNGNELVWEEWTDKGFFNNEGKLVEIHSIGRNISEQKNAELKIIEGKRRLELAQKIGKIGNWEVDCETQVRIWSAEMYVIFNCDPDKFTPTSSSVVNLVHIEDQHILAEWMNKSMQGAHLSQIEYRIPNKDGSLKYIIALSDFVVDADGRIVKIFGTAQDITTQKLAAIKIQENEKRLALAQKIAQIGNWEFDIKTGTRVWSHELYNIYNCDPNEPIPALEKFLELHVHPNDHSIILDRLQQAKNGISIDDAEYRIINTDGSYKTIFAKAELVYDKYGNPAKVLGTSQDITSQKSANLQLQKSEERLREAQQISKIGSWTTNMVTGRRFWSNEMHAIFDHDPKDGFPSSNFFIDAVHPHDKAKMRLWLENPAETIKSGSLEYRIISKNGITKHLLTHGYAVFDENNKLLKLFGTTQDITERKLAEIKIQESEQRLIRAQKIAKIGSWEIDYITEKRTWSKEMFHLYNCSQIDFIPTRDSIVNLIHPEDRHILRDWQNKSEKGIDVGQVEYRLLNSDGSVKHILAQGELTFDESGKVIKVCGTSQDITELKKSYKLIQETENKFKKIFETIHDVYYQTSNTGIITLISPSVFSLLGYTPEEMIGLPIAQFYKNPKLNQLKTGLQHFLGNTEDFEATLNTTSGSEVTVSIKLNIIRQEGEKNYRVQGLMRNITDKKRQEKDLENQRQRLIEIVKLNTQIIETSDQFFYVLDVENNSTNKILLKYISPQVSTILGLSEIEIMQNSERWLGLIHPDERVTMHDCMDEIFNTKKPIEVTYRLLNQSSGLYIWVDDYICPLLDDQNNVIEIYGSVKDISDRKNAILKVEDEKKQTAASQLQLLSSQLNPHFIYNTLNAFQFYILKGNVEESLNHISEFSQLMRKVLENSMHQSITIEDEINFLKQYVEISKRRMKGELSFEVIVHPEIEITEQLIPPMLLQPYVENSIIHGFGDLDKDCKIEIRFKKIDERIFCSVEDNGIGRLKSQELKLMKNQLGKLSFAVAINNKRINLLNQITNQEFNVDVFDLHNEDGEGSGTKVVVNYLQFEEQY